MHAAAEISQPAKTALNRALNDVAPDVRIEAAAALVDQSGSPAALELLQRELQSDRGTVSLAAARSLELLGPKAVSARNTMRETLAALENRPGDAWMFVRFSLGAALETE